jgi:hypothetical protein
MDVKLSLLIIAVLGAAAGGAAASPPPPLTPAAAVDGHCAAWNTPDRGERDRLLRRVFASDGVYSDPTPTYARGRAALSASSLKLDRTTTSLGRDAAAVKEKL